MFCFKKYVTLSKSFAVKKFLGINLLTPRRYGTDGRVVPEEYWAQWEIKGWRNFFENTAAVQFDHRVLAITTLVAVTGLWVKHRGEGPRGRRGIEGSQGFVGFFFCSRRISSPLIRSPRASLRLASFHLSFAFFSSPGKSSPRVVVSHFLR